MLSLHLPSWSIDLVRRRWRRRAGPEPALVLVCVRHGQLAVERTCERARTAGVRAGMSLPHARSLVQSARPARALEVEPLDPDRERRALERLAVWARRRFSPVVAPDPHGGGLLLDVTGCARLHGGEERLMKTLLRAVSRLGFAARVAVAPTVGCAWAVARFEQGDVEHQGTLRAERASGARESKDAADRSIAIIPPDGERAALAPLPVAALRVPPAVEAALSDVGVHRVGQLLDLPRPSLLDRFGRALLDPLDRATGRRFEPVEPPALDEPVIVERELPAPVADLEAIVHVARELLDELAVRLRRAQTGARRVRLVLERVDGPDVAEELVLSRPSGDADHLFSLFRPRIDRLHLGWGVERVRLQTEPTRLLPPRQATRFLADDDGALDEGVAVLIDRLAERLGKDAVGRMETVPTHVPERSFARRPMLGEAVELRRPRRAAAMRAVVDADRPSVLFDRPEPIEVTCLEERPVTMARRGVVHRIVRALGPERIASRWWLAARDDERRRPPRDYWKLQDADGAWWWAFRAVGAPRDASQQRWFLHGRWA